MQKYDPDVVVPPLKPMCLSTNGLKHKLVPVENEGWYVPPSFPRKSADEYRENWNWEKKVITSDSDLK